MTIATASDYAQLQKEYNKDARGISAWERYFYQPLQQAYQTQTQQIATQANYDISGAYSAYKKQQLQLLQNQQLASGFKEKIADEIFGDYQTTHNDILLKYSDSANKLNEEYKKALNTNETLLLEQGQKLSDIEKYIYDFAGVDTTKLDVTQADGGLEYYKLNPKTGMRELTRYGKDFFEKQLLAPIENKGYFSDYLATQDSKLYDYYAENAEMVRNLVGDIDKNTTKYDPYKLSSELAQEKYEAAYGDRYAVEKTTFDTPEEKYKYYTDEYEKRYATPVMRGHLKKHYINTGGKIVTIDGEQYMIDDGWQIGRYDSEYDDINGAAYELDAKDNDIFEYKGVLYIVDEGGTTSTDSYRKLKKM